MDKKQARRNVALAIALVVLAVAATAAGLGGVFLVMSLPR